MSEPTPPLPVVIYVLTAGGPGTATTSVAQTIFSGFFSGDYAYQMANAMIFFVITLLFAMVYKIDLDEMADAVHSTAPKDQLARAYGVYEWAIKKRRGGGLELPKHIYDLIACPAVVTRNGQCTLQGKWSGEDCETAKCDPFALLDQTIAPVQRCAQRLVARQHRAAAPRKQTQVVVEARFDLLDCQ